MAYEVLFRNKRGELEGLHQHDSTLTFEQLIVSTCAQIKRTATVFLYRDNTINLVVDTESQVGWKSIKATQQIIGVYEPHELPEILTTYARML